MNALDKVIGYFSPERAYRRGRFRAAAETFAYDGAKSGRRTDGWIAAGGDANTEVGASLASLRNRSRDLLRNNPYASKAIAELVGNTVGTGIVPQAKTGNPTLDAGRKLQRGPDARSCICPRHPEGRSRTPGGTKFGG